MIKKADHSYLPVLEWTAASDQGIALVVAGLSKQIRALVIRFACRTVALTKYSAISSFSLFVKSNPNAARYTQHIWIGLRNTDHQDDFFEATHYDNAAALEYFETIFAGCTDLKSLTATEDAAGLPWSFPPCNTLIEVAYIDIWSREFINVPRVAVGTLYRLVLAQFANRQLAFPAQFDDTLIREAGLDHLDSRAKMVVCMMTGSMIESVLGTPRSLIPPRVRLSVSEGEVEFDSPTASFDIWMERTLDPSIW